jgi:flagellar biosynthesis/type III secretory pathway protein FliH
MPPLKLEVFQTEPKDAPSPHVVVTDETAIEEAKLAAYEQGYTAGWDDAAAAQREEQGKIKADLGRNLQALGFTFQEARQHVLQALEPLLSEMSARLLPEMARETLAPIVLETLMPLAEQLSDAPITILLNPGVRDEVEALLSQATGLPMTIVEEPSLAESQVYLRLGAAETKVDLGRATSDIAAAVRSFFNLTEEERRHG